MFGCQRLTYFAIISEHTSEWLFFCRVFTTECMMKNISFTFLLSYWKKHYLCNVVWLSPPHTLSILLKRSRITTSKNVASNLHTQLGCADIGADLPIVYEACGEPESVGGACAFSFSRCWCCLAENKIMAILQNNI